MSQDDPLEVCEKCQGTGGFHYLSCPNMPDSDEESVCGCPGRFIGRHAQSCAHYIQVMPARPVSPPVIMGAANMAPRVDDAQTVEIIARVAHEVNRAYCLAIDEADYGTWEECADHIKISVRDGVRFHLRSPVSTPEASHNNWMKKKFQQGWRLGPEKDGEKKLSPNLVAFEQLPIEQRVKDYLFRAVVNAMS